MTVRQTGSLRAECNTDTKQSTRQSARSLAAIANPMGITILDINTPQRSYLTLNYSTSTISTSTSSYNDKSIGNGGITTMAFQPCFTNQLNSSTTNGTSSYIQSAYTAQQPILLATARGNGILIWDCSGQSLSPLLGRLNALDSWSSKKRKNVADDTTTNNKDQEREGREGQMVDESGHQPSTSLDSSTATSTQDGLKSSILSPISIERQPSVLSVSSNANNNNNLLNTSSNSGGGTSTINQSAMNKTSAATTSSVLMNNNNVVTSLDWKKSTSAPILLATCGASSCIWDLRTSLFSGMSSNSSSSSSGGARPNLRFTITPQSDIYYNPSTTLIHCSYSLTNEYTFATLDNLGIVRVWDERKPGEFSIQSFVGCSGGGVGIASISPQKKNKEGADGDDVYYSRWVTWGMDDNENEQHSSDDLIVKVWTESSSSKKVHNRSMSTSTDADVSNRSEDASKMYTDVYNCTSRISMQGGVAARVHPSFPNGILLFRDTTPSSSQRQGEGALPSPNTAAAATPEMVSTQTPPSPPPLMLDDAVRGGKTTERLESSRDHQGWEAELWCIDEDTPVVTDTDTSGEAGDDTATAQGAKKIASFRSGGVEDDALNFAPRRGIANESSDVIAVDLALGTSSPKKEEELSVCVLSKAGRLTVYGVPEASELVKEKESSPSRRVRSDSKSNSMARSLSPAVYRQGTLDHHASQWWNKNEEEDLFGEASSRDSPKKSSMESLTSAALDNKSTNDNDAEKATAVGQSISSDVSTLMEEVVVSQDAETSTNNIPIDPARAARVPCPPLCGVAFSGTGELITFNNGPVKQMWSYYQANGALSPNGPKSLSSTISFEPNNTNNSSDTNTANGDEGEGSTDQDQVTNKRTLPRTLADLIDMNLRSQTLQWGEGNDDQPDNDDDEEEEEDDDGSSSDNSSEVALDDDSDDDDELEGGYHMVSNDSQHKREDSSDMFDEYFASSRKPLLGEENKGANEVFAGLPSLSPSVLITRKYDDILLNGQTPQLANMLKLGDEWWLSQDFSVPDIGRCQIIKKNTTNSKGNKQQPSSGDDSNREGSSIMGSLKKMFANQLPSVIAASSSRNKQTTQVGAHLDRPGHAFDGYNKVDQPGVYMLDNPQTPEAASQRLLVTQELCLYNAKVCLDCGQKSKADTWTLLAQTVENILTFETDETDGWGGDEDALTTGIVEQILLWYEVQGDYQMLTTIVCVLSFGRDRRGRTASGGGGGRYRLLPKYDDRQYDNYIHRYGTLLYAWGLLTVRSEISKRLAYEVSNPAEEVDDMKGSFISTVCTKCVEPISDVNGICSKCKEYAFQCSICCSAVRGAYTWCLSCNHGGHVQCHQEWFKEQNMCPSGCGCECKVISGSTTS